MSGTYQIIADRVFGADDNGDLRNQVVDVCDGLITNIRPVENDDMTDKNALRAEILAPGFIDIQINGGGDIMFNDAPTVATLQTICNAARQGGTAHILPTFTTAPNQDYTLALNAVSAAIEQRIGGVLGVHLEGPFLSRFKPGIHPPDCIRQINSDDLAALTAPRPGVKLITLAPEEDEVDAISQLSRNGWVVFAGHSNTTAGQAAAAKAKGLSGATHLFNAMTQITVREAGLAGYTVNDDDLYAGVIVDGHHVDITNVNIAYKLMGPDRLILVTDAMQTLTGQLKEFLMGGRKVCLRAGRIEAADGTLAGAHLAMDEAVRNTVRLAGIPLNDALKMASLAPAKALDLDTELGKIAVGYRASLTLLDANLTPSTVIVDGTIHRLNQAK